MFFLVFSYCFLGMFNIEYRNVIPKIIVFNKESFLLLILLIIISGISVLIGLKLKRAFVPMSKLAKEEKTWFRKVSMSG